MDSFEKVYPTAEELSRINKNLSCPECSSIFNSDSNLNLHLARTHKKPELLQQNSSKKIYHCPVASCSYNSSAYFKQLKFLKQHYLKMHSERNYICEQCQKGFPSEAYRNRHAEYCNVSFKCCDCDMFYPCYETLKTHSRRKKHNILEKAAYKMSTPNTPLKISKSDVLYSPNKIRLLLPKPSSSTGMIIIANNTSEQSSQTDRGSPQQNSQETQTLILTTKLPQFTVETQTIGDYFTKKTEPISNTLKSTKTQTSASNPKTASCNTSFVLEDFEMNVNDVQRNSSSTQTAIFNESDYLYSSSTSTHDSIHTDTSDLLTDTLDSNFFNCNMETQTDFMFNDELFKYCDDYTNMCTQTCEDLLLGEIELNNMYTQTVFDDVLRSVESQTIMSQSKRLPLSCKDMSHMETQTDMHFKQMLEEINA